MEFARTFRVLTYLTPLWAFIMLAVTGQLHLAAIILYLGLFLLAMFRRRLNIQISNRTWTIVRLGAFITAIYGWQFIGERIYSVVYFFLYLQMDKLWTAEKNRDYLQIYALSFFQVLASSIMTASLAFAPLFAVYVFLIMSSMILFTIKRDAELTFGVEKKYTPRVELEPVRLTDRDRRRLDGLFTSRFLTGRVMAWFAASVVFILVVGMGIFHIVPRIKTQSVFMGLSMGGGRAQKSGFSDEVQFGGLGSIQNDPAIAMRVVPLTSIHGTPWTSSKEPPLPLIRMRGTSLDYYDGTTWKKGPQVIQARRNVGAHHDFTLSLSTVAQRGFKTRIFLEPNQDGYLLGPGYPYEFVFEQSIKLVVDPVSPSIQAEIPNWTSAMAYEVEGAIQREDWWATPEETERLPKNFSDAMDTLLASAGRDLASLFNPAYRHNNSGDMEAGIRDIYTQVPQIDDMANLDRIAREWTAGLEDPQEIAEAIERRLQTEFDYSLSSDFTNRADHLSYFLENAKSGHCEYFATSMAMMLRSLDIPARIVNGFLSDEWSGASGGYYIVRQQHAHSWVEAYMPQVNAWITFDPTPSGGIGSNRIASTFYRRLTHVLDGVKMIWYERVIDFDLGDQQSMFRDFRRMIGGEGAPSLFRIVSDLKFTTQRGLSKGRTIALVLLFGLVAVAGFFLVREIRGYLISRFGDGKRTGRIRMESRASVRPYIDLLTELEKKFDRDPALTPREYALRVTRDYSGMQDFLPLTERYYGARYHGEGWSEEETARAQALLHRWKELRKGKGKSLASTSQ